MKNKIIRTICYILTALIFLFGFLIFIYPLVNRAVINNNAKNTIQSFQNNREEKAPYLQKYETFKNEFESDVKAPEKVEQAGEFKYEELYMEMLKYNKKIYKEGQSGIKDAWTFAQPDFDLSSYGVSDNVIAEIRIPKMKCELPVYLGASGYNMARGAAQLGQTSMPTGGRNTNCVLAGHRGASGGRFFLDIELLQKGDRVYIDNLWETLVYKVTDIKIIYPYESDKIMIQEGKDMLTLITCHPYPTNAMRYAVFCERTVESEGGENTNAENSVNTQSDTEQETAINETTDSNQTETEIDSSKGFIAFENVMYVAVPIFLVILTIFLLWLNSRAKKKKRK